MSDPTYKFGRTFALFIQKNTPDLLGNFVEVVPPMTIDFDINRNDLLHANACTLRVYNLSPEKRDQLWKDPWDTTEAQCKRTVEMRAGHGLIGAPGEAPTGATFLFFKGQIASCTSYRDGTNYITEIQALDGGYAISHGEFTLERGVTAAMTYSAVMTMIMNLPNSLPGVKPGYVSPTYTETVGGTLTVPARGISLSGNTAEELSRLSGGAFFVDNMVANVVSQSEAILAAPVLVNAATGLIGTPRYGQLWIEFEMVFEPKLAIGRKVFIEVPGIRRINGLWTVRGLSHRGMFSDSVAGQAISIVRAAREGLV